MSIKKASSLVMFAAVALAISTMIGCGKSDDAEQSSGPGTAMAALPADLFLAAAPDSPVSVKQVKAEAKEGDEVVVRVVVGGEVNVFVDGRAIAKVVGVEMENLCLSPDDHCKTPWDYCCAASEELQPHRATVRVVDAEGKTLKVGLKGAGQIEESTTMVVKGVVAKGSDGNNLVIDARGIYVEN